MGQQTTRPAGAVAGPPPHPPSGASRGQMAAGDRQPTLDAATVAELRRGSVLDAARGELARRCWSEVTMSDIALAAGVSRGTVYREVGSREEFARELLQSESDRFFGVMEAMMDAPLSDRRAALLLAFELFLTVISSNALIRAATVGDDRVLTAGASASPAERSCERLQAAILSRWPHVVVGDAVALSECLLRLASSYAVLPATSATDTASSAVELFGPYVEQLLGEEEPVRAAGRRLATHPTRRRCGP